MPKVSVILTSYNHEKYIAAAIESVLNQTFTDFELLIVDDGSKDNSQKIIRSYKDKRIKIFIHEKNIGAVQSVLECQANSVGKYAALHHSDDLWEPSKLEKQVNFLEKNSQYEVCFTQAKFIDENGAPFELPENHTYKNAFQKENRPREQWLNYLFWKSNCFCNPSMLIVNTRENFNMEPYLLQLPDYCMWTRFCLKKSPYVLPEELTSFRLRRGDQNSVSSASLEKSIRISNEVYQIARAFLPILRNEKFFLKVFPEAEEFLVDGKISTEFAFAQFCLKKNVPAFQKLALEILYDLFHNDKKRNLIKKLYDYDWKNFFGAEGKFDVFNIKATLKILNCRLYFNFGGGFNEKDSVAVPTLIRQDGNFTATFDFSADNEIESFRFDPDEKAALAIKILKITVNGELVENFTSNAFKNFDGYYNFVTADPFFTIEKKISAEKVHVEILGAVKDDALLNLEKTYNETCATLQEKIFQLQQQENTIRQKENLIQEKNSQLQQLENSLQEKLAQIQQLENIISTQNENLNQLNAVINNLQSLQREILNSNSWKITKPLRSIGKILRKI